MKGRGKGGRRDRGGDGWEQIKGEEVEDGRR
jgi:hypothetical protein